MRKSSMWNIVPRMFHMLMVILISIGLTLQIPPLSTQAEPAIFLGLEVDTTADDISKSACTTAFNDCSLRGAIAHINMDVTLPSPEYLIILGSNTYTLSNHGSGEDLNLTGDLDLNYSGIVSIEGTGMFNTIIDGDHADRVIEQSAGTLNLKDLAIRNGVITNVLERGGGVNSILGSILNLNEVSVDHNISNNYGGGVASTGGTLTIWLSIIDQNQSPDGGGVFISDTDLTVFGSLFSNNTATTDGGGGLLASATGSTNIFASVFIENAAARGGGIFNGGTHTMNIYDSIIRSNDANQGGGVKAYGTFNLQRVEVSGNSADSGAGLALEDSTFNLTNVTIAQNASVGGASAVDAAQSSGSLNGALNHVTITENYASGGGSALEVYAGSIRLLNSILASSDGNFVCEESSGGAITSFDYNIDTDGTCNLTLANDHPNTDPGLRLLGSYGSLTLSAPPGRGSLAIDHADASFSPGATDQRGIFMLDGDGDGIVVPDIGAVEGFPDTVFFPLVMSL
jgi:predicted outer membrane repeat protein